MRVPLTLAAVASAMALAACSSHNTTTPPDNTLLNADQSDMATMPGDNGMMGNGAADNMAAMNGATAAPMPTDAAGFVKAAGASDLFEIRSAKVALQKAKDAKVRDFAQMMITDHTKTTDAVKAAAKKAGLNPAPPQLTADQQQKLDQLQPLTGQAFDQAYVAQQMPAHQQALAMLQNYAQNGDQPALKQAAQQAIPIVQKHINRLQELQQ